MTPEDLQKLVSVDGLWIIGSKSKPANFSQPVGVLSGIPHALRLGNPLSTDARDWHEDTFISGGPYNAMSIEDLDRKAEEVEHLVLSLEAQAEFWRSMCQRMKPLVEIQTLSPLPNTRVVARGILNDLREAEEAVARENERMKK